MDKVMDKIAKNPYFVVFASICSIVSFGVSVVNEKIVLWLICTMALFTMLSVIWLVNQNSRMLKRLDDVKCEIFNRDIDLEYDEVNENFYTKTPLLIVITSFLTQETVDKSPTVFVTVNYPSQLRPDFSFSTDYISREDSNSNSVKFKIKLKSETNIITLRSLNLLKEKENEYQESDKKIYVTFEGDLLDEPKKESILVSL